MTNLDNMFAAADLLSDNEVAQQLLEPITSIMEIPEEELNENSIEVMLGMINGAFTDNVKEQVIKAIIQDFETQNLTRLQAQQQTQSLKQGFDNLILELKPSEMKKRLLDNISNLLCGIYEIALKKYHSFDIELPIMLDEGARLPTYAHESDACADVYAIEDIVVRAHTLGNKIRTGLHFGLPENWEIGLLPRSSISSKTGLRLSNSRAVIDEQFRDEMIILYDNISDSDYTIKAGDRIAQMFVQPTYRFKGVEVSKNEFDKIEGNRGGGLGSSGK